MFASLFAFLLSLATVTASFQVTPKVFYHYDGVKFGEVHYTTTLDQPGRLICTGWIYPIYNIDKEDWPLRRSCRIVDRRIIQEAWGGKRYPLPFIGKYLAFLEVYDQKGLVLVHSSEFTQLEGIPAS